MNNKKTYVTPMLTIHGDVQKITLRGGTTGVDNNPNGRPNPPGNAFGLSCGNGNTPGRPTSCGQGNPVGNPGG